MTFDEVSVGSADDTLSPVQQWSNVAAGPSDLPPPTQQQVASATLLAPSVWSRSSSSGTSAMTRSTNSSKATTRSSNLSAISNHTVGPSAALSNQTATTSTTTPSTRRSSSPLLFQLSVGESSPGRDSFFTSLSSSAASSSAVATALNNSSSGAKELRHDHALDPSSLPEPPDSLLRVSQSSSLFTEPASKSLNVFTDMSLAAHAAKFSPKKYSTFAFSLPPSNVGAISGPILASDASKPIQHVGFEPSESRSPSISSDATVNHVPVSPSKPGAPLKSGLAISDATSEVRKTFISASPPRRRSILSSSLHQNAALNSK